MKLALVYDRINKWGGAERLLTHLHHLWPQAPVYTGVYHSKRAPWARGWDIRPSFVNRLPLAPANHEWYFWLMPLGLETLDLSRFDTVLSVCSDFTKGVITRPQQQHISYILSPTRYLWLAPQEYRRWANFPLMPVILNKLRLWDYIAAQRPDKLVTISEPVRRQIHKYYHRDATVIYPPTDTDFFKPAENWKLTTDNYFLIVSRLVPHKNIKLAITAFNQLRLPLKIVGTGRHEQSLRRLAGPTVEFSGELTDSQLLGYYQHCRGLIFPGEESFGLAMVEAQACGKPVIALKRGGATEIINHETGILFDSPTISQLVTAVSSFPKAGFSWQACRHNARRFSLDKFNRAMKQIL
jgi:glycosyltransferase involved in cell wall biosynthesis